MKKLRGVILLASLAVPIGANANCINDLYGNVVCGKGQCEADRFGKIYCADAGGGAMKDQFANVQCGVGYCAKDKFGHVWCSKEPGGGAATDSTGKVKCLGGCDEGSPSQCKEGH